MREYSNYFIMHDAPRAVFTEYYTKHTHNRTNLSKIGKQGINH